MGFRTTGCIYLIVLLLVTAAEGQTSPPDSVSSKKYNKECIIDKAQPASALNNYMNCTKSGKTTGLKDCCLINKKVNCCNKSENIVKLILYVTAILVTSLVLAAICFIIYWSDTWPWVGRLKERVTHCCPRKKTTRDKENLKSERTDPDPHKGTNPDDFWTTP